MLASLSSNAVSAKARGMHGKRLTNNNFMDLLNCKTVHDVAYYLKNRTSYNKLLAGINENEVSRSELEVLLKQKIFDDRPDLGKCKKHDHKRNPVRKLYKHFVSL